MAKSLSIFKYHYVIKNIVMTLDANYNFDDGSVSYFSIDCDYMNRICPVINMRLEMPVYMAKKFYEHQDDAMIKFDIYEYQYAGEAVVGISLWFQHSFRAIPAKDINNYITSTDTITEQEMDPMRGLQQMDMYLIDMDMVKKFTQKITGIYNNISKAAAIHTLFQLRNFPTRNVIATPPAQDSIIPNCVISMGTLPENISELNNRYGIYTSNPIVFYDLDYVYVIDRFDPNVTLSRAKDFSNITFIYKNLNLPDRNMCGSCNDPSSKTHFINFEQTPTVEDYRPESSSQNFGTITTVNKEGTVNKETIDDNATALRYVYEENDQTSSQYINESLYNRTITVNVPDVALSFIKPYKNVTFQCGTMFSSLGLDSGATYRILRWTAEIVREGSGTETSYLHSVSFNLQQIDH